ncbi:MAG: fucose isomerase [Clostridiales bacterium]|jgi:L-fucose isomerase-like protein|nr:fucose isomerase [Clostridiales bacterium]
MLNIPDVKLGVISVSRDCFPMTLSARRREAVVGELALRNIDIYESKVTVENETDVLKALAEVNKAHVSALVIYLGNFGPEGPETLLAQKFDGPVMFAAAAEETGEDLINGRGDAYCGMLNASYNIALRGLHPYIPAYPLGTAAEIAALIEEFIPIARVLVGLKKFKIFSFGPRPYDFLACNAPIKPLFDLGVEIQENSELDLYASYKEHADDPRITDVVKDMANELGSDRQAEFLKRLARYELTLLDWAEKNKGASEFFAFANKCWPAFQTQFEFVPCYVNSRLTQSGAPVSCETDIYGALTEYIITLASDMPPTLLDINNTIPYDMFEKNKEAFAGYKPTDVFMGFHCGNTASCYLKSPEIKYQFIMKRSLEPDKEPDITRGTLEGAIKPSDVTLFRLQSTADSVLRGYIAEGRVLDVDPRSFGGIGVIGIPEMARFYRHVLIEGRYPHHAGVAFRHVGKTLFNVLKLLGVRDIGYNHPAGALYNSENPFA